MKKLFIATVLFSSFYGSAQGCDLAAIQNAATTLKASANTLYRDVKRTLGYTHLANKVDDFATQASVLAKSRNCAVAGSNYEWVSGRFNQLEPLYLQAQAHAPNAKIAADWESLTQNLEVVSEQF